MWDVIFFYEVIGYEIEVFECVWWYGLLVLFKGFIGCGKICFV